VSRSRFVGVSSDRLVGMSHRSSAWLPFVHRRIVSSLVGNRSRVAASPPRLFRQEPLAMRRIKILAVVVGVWMGVVIAGVSPSSAQTLPAPPAPRIFSVVPDLAGMTLVISGLRFGDGAEVWVDGQLLPVLPGATDERLEIDVPAGWRAQAGTYRLVVRTANGRTDSFEVTVGGAGAWGAAGGRLVDPSTASPADAEAARSSSAPARRAGATTAGATRPGIAPSVTEIVGYPYTTAVGYRALIANTGPANTAAGYEALFANTSGFYNTATGASALYSNTTGYFNTATGTSALYLNSSGYSNTAAGYQAMYFNTTGTGNTAAGSNALFYNTTGGNNTATGVQALNFNTTGSNNMAA
jgi:hypothetical protein